MTSSSKLLFALDARDNDVMLEDHSVQLYAPVTSAGHTTHTSANSCFLSGFQQFCKESNAEPAGSDVTLHQTVSKSAGEWQGVKTTQLAASHSHNPVVQTNVPQHCMSSGHVAVPVQRLVDVGLSSARRFQVYTADGLMGNRLQDCAVAGGSATGDHQRSVPGLVDMRTYRDCGQWSPVRLTSAVLQRPTSAVLQHSSSTQWSSGQQVVPSCDVNRPAWASPQSLAALNGIGTGRNYPNYVRPCASQVYAHPTCSQMLNQFPPGVRCRPGSIPGVQQVWMSVRPQLRQQQIAASACRTSMTVSPVRSASLLPVGQSSTSPNVWQSRFASQSLMTGHTTDASCFSRMCTTDAASTSQSVSTATVSAASSCQVTGPDHSPLSVSVRDAFTLRNNNVGRIYQLPVQTVAMTSVHSPCDTSSLFSAVTCVHSQCETSVGSSLSACVASATTASLSASTTATSKPAVNVKPVMKAVITPSQPEPERTYVAGRRYTITKEDGVTVEGIWDGKYLTVLTTTASSNTASQTPAVTNVSASTTSTTSVSSATAVSPSTVVSSPDTASPDLIVLPSKRHLSQNGCSDEVLECRVTLEKCDKPGSGGTVVGGGKRSKAQSKAPASHSRGKLRSTVTIDKQKFYSIPVDQLTRPPLRSRIRRHISARNHHRLSVEPISVIHIDGDDDSDDVDQAPQLTTDERVMDDSTNVSSQKSCGARGGGSSSVNVTDATSVVIKLQSMMFGQNRQPASEARFFDKQLVITTKSDLTASKRLTLVPSDLSSVQPQFASCETSLSKFHIRVCNSYRIQLVEYFQVLAPHGLETDDVDQSFQSLVIFFFLKPSQREALLSAVRQLSSHMMAASDADDADASESMFDMECQDYGTHVAGCPIIQQTSEQTQEQEPTANRASPVFGRRSIHDVKPTASLQALHAYDGCDQDDDSEDPLTSNASHREEIVVPVGFNSQIIKLFTYPPPPAVGGICVTNEDLYCLNDGEFLNDVIIEFYIKYMFNEILTAEQRERTHIFNTFFYGQLTKENRDTASGLSVQQRRHSQVKRWTKHVDLFSKDFIVIPINEDSHWYLAIICFPYLVGVKQSLAVPHTVTAQQQLKQKKDDCAAGSEQQCNKSPCILIFDSLKTGVDRWSVAVTLREYLQIEWDQKKVPTEGPRSFDKPTMKGATPGCPQQSNSSDCGVYVLQYIESFFQHPLHDFTLPIRYLKDWFPENEVISKRRAIRRLIASLTRRLNPSLNYDPQQDGCDVDEVVDS